MLASCVAVNMHLAGTFFVSYMISNSIKIHLMEMHLCSSVYVHVSYMYILDLHVYILTCYGCYSLH